jgi:lipopolysaccharide transport system ATP-binding protein
LSPLAIKTVEIGKRYRRGLQLEPYKTAREAIVRLAKRPFGGREAKPDQRLFWALKDINLEVQEGEAVAVIGRNGAGKTTLLKLLSQITKPTAGYAEVRGRVGTLLEVGTSFHLELTGRENIYLNGAILGMTRSEIRRKMDEIIEFAEVGPFVDTPLKRYSTGMNMRLAFSVAAHMEPDILMVDEVLAVGDTAFQKKCLGKLGEVETEGRTVIFVSHIMPIVMQICQRGIVLDRGQVVFDGPVNAAIDRYMTTLVDTVDELSFAVDPSKDASFVRLATRNEHGERSARFGNEESILLEAEFQANKRLTGDHVWLYVERADGTIVVEALDTDGGGPVPRVREPGRYVVGFAVPPNILNEGTYRFNVSIGKLYSAHDERASAYFEVEDVTDYRDSHFVRRVGVVLLPLASEERQLDRAIATAELR